MSYIQKEWKTGDTIDADALNHMEQGISNASSGEGDNVIYVDLTGTDQPSGTSAVVNLTLEASAQDLYEYIVSGKTVRITDKITRSLYGSKYKYSFTGGIVQMSAESSENELKFSIVCIGNQYQSDYLQTLIFDPVTDLSAYPTYKLDTRPT